VLAIQDTFTRVLRIIFWKHHGRRKQTVPDQAFTWEHPLQDLIHHSWFVPHRSFSGAPTLALLPFLNFDPDLRAWPLLGLCGVPPHPHPLGEVGLASPPAKKITGYCIFYMTSRSCVLLRNTRGPGDLFVQGTSRPGYSEGIFRAFTCYYRSLHSKVEAFCYVPLSI